MTYTDLIQKAVEVIHEPDETTIERFLQTMKNLLEPEDELDKSLRLLIVDMAVAEYLGTCKCSPESEKQ